MTFDLDCWSRSSALGSLNALYLVVLCINQLISFKLLWISSVESVSFPLISRYLLYDVNPGEGFNLRRDVYLRVSNLVKNLNEKEPWVLVLPPWGNLYHWKSRHLGLEQIKIPWATFFDIPSLRKFVPVIEFEEFLKGTVKTIKFCNLH